MLGVFAGPEEALAGSTLEAGGVDFPAAEDGLVFSEKSSPTMPTRFTG
jgi:hypothetical protein